MDLLICLIIGVISIVLSKDMYIEDRDTSISEIVRNLETTKTTTIDDISIEEEKKIEERFGLDEIEDFGEDGFI